LRAGTLPAASRLLPTPASQPGDLTGQPCCDQWVPALEVESILPENSRPAFEILGEIENGVAQARLRFED
jgi:hypothetical protein